MVMLITPYWSMVGSVWLGSPLARMQVAHSSISWVVVAALWRGRRAPAAVAAARGGACSQVGDVRGVRRAATARGQPDGGRREEDGQRTASRWLQTRRRLFDGARRRLLDALVVGHRHQLYDTGGHTQVTRVTWV